MARNLMQARRGGSFHLGAAAVGVGSPISAREYAASRGIAFRELEREDRIEEVKVLAELLMETINGSIPDTAVPLLARALLEAPERAVPQETLIANARTLAEGEGPLDYEGALRKLAARGLVLAERGGYCLAPGSEKLIGYYAGSSYR